MYTETMLLLGLAIALFSACSSMLTVRRVKKQIVEMTAVLEDVKNGNGNRRILSETHELVAPLAYEINDIILSYENRLSACHQTEEANRQLMTSLSHDVRTPLTTLIGYLDAAHKRIVEGKERDDYIETARRKAHDLKEYIDALFDWFKLGSNEFSINIKAVDLTELTRNILIDWIPIFEDTRVDFVIDIPEQPFRVQIDPDGYMRILNNLIQNVISHSHADKIEIAQTIRNTEKRCQSEYPCPQRAYLRSAWQKRSRKDYNDENASWIDPPHVRRNRAMGNSFARKREKIASAYR